MYRFCLVEIYTFFLLEDFLLSQECKDEKHCLIFRQCSVSGEFLLMLMIIRAKCILFPMHVMTSHLNWCLDCIPNWGCVTVVFLSWRGILMYAWVPAFVLLLSKARKIKTKKRTLLYLKIFARVCSFNLLLLFFEKCDC